MGVWKGQTTTGSTREGVAQMGLMVVKIGGDNGKNGDEKRHQTSHDFWGRKNLGPTQAPITHAMPLALLSRF